jgi:hypothetical protein
MNTKTCISNDTVDVLTDAETPMYTETNFTAAAFNDLPDVLALASTKMFFPDAAPVALPDVVISPSTKVRFTGDTFDHLPSGEAPTNP